MGSDGNFAFLLPLIFVTFGGVLLLVSHWGSLAAKRWGTGYLFAAMGFVMPVMADKVPVELVALTADALFLTAAYCYSDALFLHFGKARFTKLRICFCAGIYVATAISVLAAGSLHAELLVTDIGFTGLLLAPLVFLWRQATQKIDRLMLFVVALTVIDCVTRNVVLVAIAPSSDSLESFASSNYAYVMQVTNTMLGLFLALTALATVVVRAISEYRDASERDPMTGLLNRRGFERVAPAADRLQTCGGVVIITDIDHFKLVNDTHGHAKGDLVLIGFAKLLQKLMPKSASISRFGGEEFVIYLPDLSIADAEYLGNTIRLAFADHDWTDIGIDRAITASFGIGRAEPGDNSIHDAIARADAALYSAKNAGRNRVMSGAAPLSIVMPRRAVSAA